VNRDNKDVLIGRQITETLHLDLLCCAHLSYSTILLDTQVTNRLQVHNVEVNGGAINRVPDRISAAPRISTDPIVLVTNQ
jgi:hypothetical protein